LGKPLFVIVDGYSLLFRAFFAMPYLSNSAGEPTGAVHGFANMLERLITEEKPDAMIVAWDAPGQTFRDATYEAYKAHRPSAPDEFKSQVKPARETVLALGIKPLELPGFEADDCIGAAAVHAVEEGYDALIVSGDSDLLQLVKPGVRVMIPKKGVSEVNIYDDDAVIERYGVRADQMVDYKALKGDTSDNIPGVKGIGDKTATTLIQTWGTLDNLYEHLDEVKPDRIRKLLEEGRESAKLSYDLSLIRCDAPCEIDPDGYHLGAPDLEKVRELFNRMEFRSLLGRVEERAKAIGNRQQPLEAPSLFDLEETQSDELREVDLDALPEEMEAARAGGRIALVPLLEGTQLLRARLVGLAWASESGPASQEARYVPLPAGGDIPIPLQTALSHPFFPKVLHDAKSLINAMDGTGDALDGLELDTMIAGYLLYAGKFNATLDTLAVETLGRNLPASPKSKAQGPKSGEPSLEPSLELGTWNSEPEALNSEVRERIAAEALALRDLAPRLIEQLQAEGLWSLYHDLEEPLIPILAQMERRGILLNPDTLREASAFLSQRISELEEEVYTLAGERFNIGSTKQLQTILFEKMGLPTGKKIKTGFSTGVEVLEELANSYPVVRKILDWREVSKLRSTYTDALLRLMDPATHRVHTTFNQAVAATGRLSSVEPNLQNIPIRTEVGREIRRAFVAPPGCHLLSADYSQIELRILAHYTDEPALVRAFNEDEDIHAATASLIFGVELDGVTPDMRRRAKTVNFAVLYGQTDFGLSKELGIGVSEARDFITQYFERFPGIKGYVDATLDAARRQGYVATLMGRRRYFPDIHSPNRNARLFAERAAVNSPIQGTAADIIKRAMIHVTRRIERENHPAQLLLQVHDELVFEVPDGEIESAAKIVREEMEGAFPLKVPVRADVKAGCNWNEMTAVPKG
jgi:DNA polymerase-1